MSTPLRFLPLVLACAAWLPAQDISFTVYSRHASSGSLCDPWSCTPARSAAGRGETFVVSVHGAAFNPHFLLVAGPQAQCLPLPGFARSLIVRTPLVAVPLPLSWGKVISSGGGSRCVGWYGTTTLPVPAGLPMRSKYLLQTVAQVGWSGPPTFSNAVEVTVL